jgi:hypothetical protein
MTAESSAESDENPGSGSTMTASSKAKLFDTPAEGVS